MSDLALHLTCFLLSIVSALVPWVNGEVLLLSLSALVKSPYHLAGLVVLASAGQMIGKCGLYWAGRGALPFQGKRIGKTVQSWGGRLQASPAKSLSLVFVSSALGIPPFYVITILAGVFRLRFGRFLVVGSCGRLLRFGLLVMIPQLGLQFLHKFF